MNIDEGRSPWATVRASIVKLAPSSRPKRSQISLPGSKSFTNRALVIAAVADGDSVLTAPLFGDDSYWCMESVQNLGAVVEHDRDRNFIRIVGIGRSYFEQPSGTQRVFIGSAGTTARFLPGLVAGAGRGVITLEATEQLSRRPVVELVEALHRLGADISFPSPGKSFPMNIVGGSLTGGETQVSGAVSSQFTSGLLIAAPLAKSRVTIRVNDSMVQPDYLRITTQVMKEFGVHVDANESFTEFIVEPQKYQARNYTLEADASTSTYFFALAACTQSELIVDNINPTTHQPDFMFVRHLESMGCNVTIQGTKVSVTGPQKLKGGQVFDFSSCSDSTPALAAIAPFADDKVEVRGVAHIRTHECDRIQVITENLTKCGVKVEEHEDGFTVYPTPNAPRFARLETHDDHRMAMAFGVLGAAGQGVELVDPACVSKTCPNYFELMHQCGVQFTFE